MLAFWMGILLAMVGFRTAAPMDRLLFGVVPAYYPSPKNIENDLRFFQMMRDAGVTHITLGFNWDNIEKERGKYDWTNWDYAVELAAKFGIEVQGCIVGCPEWALPTSGDLGWLPVALNMPREECIPDFERFVTELGRRYAGKVKMFEFWNEPNGYNMAPVVPQGDPRYRDKIAHYTRFLMICYKALKRGNPEAILAHGGMDSSGVTGVWLEGVYENGGKGFFDAVAIHPYKNDPPYVDEEYIRRIREIMKRHGDEDLPIWINEWGVYNPTEEVIKTAIDTVKDKHPYVTILTYHTFVDFSGGPWGLVTEHLVPKSGYLAFKRYPKPPRMEPIPDPKKGTIRGRVIDNRTGKPIPGAVVYAQYRPGALYGALSDEEGWYEIGDIVPGTYEFTASSYDYKPQTKKAEVAEGAKIALDFSLQDLQPLADSFEDDFEMASFPCAIDVSRRWKFKTDPEEVGLKDGWERPDYKDEDWKEIDAGKTWEEQGIQYDGYAWYRKWVRIPAEWKGGRVFLTFGGVDDAYDLYVNGDKISSFGQPDVREGAPSVWNQPTYSDITPAIRFGEENLLVLRVLDRAVDGGIRDLPAMIYSKWFFKSDVHPGRQEIVPRPVHSGNGALYGESKGKRFGHYASVSVRESGTVLEFWFYIPSDKPGRKVMLEVSAASSSLSGSRTVYPEAPLNRWTHVSVPIEEISPGLRGRAIQIIGITAISDTDGVSLLIDDLSMR
jgi:hypothetical protein